jgi:hypothetical protein
VSTSAAAILFVGKPASVQAELTPSFKSLLTGRTGIPVPAGVRSHGPGDFASATFCVVAAAPLG